MVQQPIKTICIASSNIDQDSIRIYRKHLRPNHVVINTVVCIQYIPKRSYKINKQTNKNTHREEKLLAHNRIHDANIDWALFMLVGLCSLCKAIRNTVVTSSFICMLKIHLGHLFRFHTEYVEEEKKNRYFVAFRSTLKCEMCRTTTKKLHFSLF